MSDPTSSIGRVREVLGSGRHIKVHTVGRIKTARLKRLLAGTMSLVAAATAVGTGFAQTTYEPYAIRTLAGVPLISGSFDGTGTPPLPFRYPTGVALDSAGNLYVADSSHNIIRKITPDGTVSTFAGLEGVAGSADGTGSAARFYNPNGVAVDSAGNVYVADTYNSTIRKITSNGVVSTLAGLAGERGTADGTGSAARFYYPTAVAVDTAGNAYVADTRNHAIRKITSKGVVTTLAPGSGFQFPSGVAVDSAGNVYVADTNNHTIRKITSGGVVSTLAGSAGPGSADGTGNAAQFFYPIGVAVDSQGNVYVGDDDNYTIRKITSGGVVTTLAGLAGMYGTADGTGSAARFWHPDGVAVDSAGNVYVADNWNQTIRKVTSLGVVSTVAGLGGFFDHPLGAAVDSTDNIYIADTFNSTIRKITSGGVVTTVAGLAGVIGSADDSGNAARFYYPTGVAVDSTGTVYVADRRNHTVRKITSGGVVTTLSGLPGAIGSADGAGSAARFFYPSGVAVDSVGNVYVADSANHTIRKITSAGVVSTLAGLAGTSGSADGTGNAARFWSPNGVAVDSADNLYVGDTNNSTIRKVTFGGVVTTIAGLAGARGSADGTASAARFYYPGGVAVDGAGNVYVADTGNHTIRKITPAGVVTTLAGLVNSLGSDDGSGSAAHFYYPGGVAVDNAGRLYVADTNNCTIRVGAPALALAAAVSRKVHGSAGTFDIDLPLVGEPGVECRDDGSGKHTLIITFSNTVVRGSAAITSGVGSVAHSSISRGNTMIVNLAGVADVQTITVTLSNVIDNFSQVWPNAPISMNVLAGDTSANKTVNSTDVSQTRLQSGSAISAANFRNDTSVDGTINATDVSQVKLNSGHGLP